MADANTADITYRPAATGDDPQIVPMLRRTLGVPDDDHYAAFLTWKHRQNPFGPSPAWVAVHDDRVVGYRAFLRWRFRDDGGRAVTAVRAVDTATAPEYRGKGIFRALTLRGVAELTQAGDAIVFNTPNDQSRPGYLKMGWSEVRKLPVGVQPRDPVGLVAMARSRVPADLWSQPTPVGHSAADLFADADAATRLLRFAPARGFRTDRTPAYLAWRTSFAPLHYRVLLHRDGDPDSGGIVFRLRRRGAALEASVIEEFVPDRRCARTIVRRLLSATRADYAIALGANPARGLWPLPGQGPVLTTRPLAASPPPRRDWRLTLADVELF